MDVQQSAQAKAETQNRQAQRGLVQSILLVFSVTLATIVNDANASAFTIALPTIQKEMRLKQTAPQLQWIVSGYPLSCGCSLLVCGRLADLYGRKKTFLIGSLILVGATLGCAFSNDVLTLNILRATQGIGAAAQIPASLGILADAFPSSSLARRIAFTTFSTGAAIGAVFGTAVSGALTEYTSRTWRSACYLLSCMSMASFVGGLVAIDADKLSEEQDKRIDWFGSLLVTAGLVQIIYALNQGQLAENKWGICYILILISGLFCSLAFLYWQYYLRKVQLNGHSYRSIFISPPLLKLSTWTCANGRVSAMMLIAFLNWGSFLAWIVWVQLYFQNYKGLTPLQTAIVLLPMFFSGIVCNIFVVLAAARIPVVWMLGIGTVATTAACLLFAVIIPEASYWMFAFPAIFLSSMGADIISSVGTLFISKVVLPHEQSVAGALFITMTQVGTAVGVTISTVVANGATARGPSSDPMSIYRAAQWTAFAFGALANIINIAAFRNVKLGDSEPSS